MTAGVVAIAGSVLLIAGCGVYPTKGAASPAALDRIVGTVLSGPTCPVERVGTSCPPRRVVRGTVELLQAGRVVQTVRTDTTGHFSFAARPGGYVLRASNVGGYRSTVERAVVVSGSTAPVTLRVDSGIR